MTTGQRLAKVERELAALRTELAERLRTRAVEIVGNTGKTRAALSVSSNGPALALFDAAGKPRAGLCITADRPMLGLYSASGAMIWRAP